MKMIVLRLLHHLAMFKRCTATAFAVLMNDGGECLIGDSSSVSSQLTNVVEIYTSNTNTDMGYQIDAFMATDLGRTND